MLYCDLIDKVGTTGQGGYDVYSDKEFTFRASCVEIFVVFNSLIIDSGHAAT